MNALILQHVACENAGSLKDALRKAGFGCEYLPLHEGASLPEDLRPYAGVVILGGPMNVYEETEYPFLSKEDRFIRRLLAENVPTLGICLGAQLIAKAAGARVISGHRKEIGWYNLTLTCEGLLDAMFSGFGKKFPVFQWHGDTFDIPAGAIKLASSEIFPNQAYRLKNAYGIQFHVEVDEKDIMDWMVEYDPELSGLDYIDPKKILRDTKKNMPGLRKNARRFYGDFISLLERR